MAFLSCGCKEARDEPYDFGFWILDGQGLAEHFKVSLQYSGLNGESEEFLGFSVEF